MAEILQKEMATNEVAEGEHIYSSTEGNVSWQWQQASCDTVMARDVISERTQQLL